MKKFLAIALYTMPLAVTPAVFAQTSSTAPSTNPSPTSPSTANPGGPAPGAFAPTPASPGAGATPSAPPAKMISGVSVKNKLMGKDVYNENNEKIGAIEDVVLASDGAAKTLVVGAGGFLGMGERNVAIPFDKVTNANDKLVLAGYTKDQLKALPEVKVTK